MLYCVVEGRLDAAVASALARHVGLTIDETIVKNGRTAIANKVAGYYRASESFAKWFVLADLDVDECPATLLAKWGVPSRSADFACRIAVREVEAWLLADAGRVARALGVSSALIPLDPEQLADPKATLVKIATRSRSRSVKTAIVPPERGLLRTGAGYSPWLIDFVRTTWSPVEAATNSPSLARCLAALANLRNRLI